MAQVMALRCCGRLNVTVRAGPCRCTRISERDPDGEDMAYLLGGVVAASPVVSPGSSASAAPEATR